MARNIHTGLNILPLSGDTQAVLIRGIGNTTGTTSLLIQDSGATQTFAVRDDGSVTVGSGATQTFAVRDDGSVMVGSETLKVVQEATLTLNQSEILTLFTTPIVIVPAPASGKAIQVISALNKYTFVSSAFTGNTVMRLITSGLTTPQFITIISHGESVIQTMPITVGSPDVTNIAEAAALMVAVDTGNPGGGNSGSVITIIITYVIIDV